MRRRKRGLWPPRDSSKTCVCFPDYDTNKSNIKVAVLYSLENPFQHAVRAKTVFFSSSNVYKVQFPATCKKKGYWPKPTAVPVSSSHATYLFYSFDTPIPRAHSSLRKKGILGARTWKSPVKVPCTFVCRGGEKKINALNTGQRPVRRFCGKI